MDFITIWLDYKRITIMDILTTNFIYFLKYNLIIIKYLQNLKLLVPKFSLLKLSKI